MDAGSLTVVGAGSPEGEIYIQHGCPDQVIEVEVKAHVRRIRRPAYTRDPGCRCEDTPAIITAPPPPRVIPRSNYDVSVWVEVILSKYRYGQPSNRTLQDLRDQGLPISPGTLAGGLQALAPLFEPILEALYCKQMSEELFHNDETRWEVFVAIEGKVGTRWYLWVTRSASVIFYSDLLISPQGITAAPERRSPHEYWIWHQKLMLRRLPVCLLGKILERYGIRPPWMPNGSQAQAPHGGRVPQCRRCTCPFFRMESSTSPRNWPLKKGMTK